MRLWGPRTRIGMVMLIIVVVLVSRWRHWGQTTNPVSEQQVWSSVRTAVPAAIPLFRPTWLPKAFHAAAVSASADLARSAVVKYCVEQDCSGATLTFALGPVSGARPDWILTIRVHGAPRNLVVTSGFPPLAISWQVARQPYVVQASEISLDDLLAETMACIPTERGGGSYACLEKSIEGRGKGPDIRVISVHCECDGLDQTRASAREVTRVWVSDCTQSGEQRQ